MDYMSGFGWMLGGFVGAVVLVVIIWLGMWSKGQ